MSARPPRGLYVYALADRPVRTDTKGIFRRPVRSLDVPTIRGLHPIVEAAVRAPRQSIRRLREQDRVLRALAILDRTSIVPARFGSFFAGEQELAVVLRDRAADLRRSLRLVRGCMQMTTRVFVEPQPSADRSRGQGRTSTGPHAERAVPSGTAHMIGLARADRARRSHPVVACVQRNVAPFVKAERVEWHDTGSVAAVSLFHLVPRTRLEPYVDALARACRGGSARVLVSGPFLPFAFADSAW